MRCRKYCGEIFRCRFRLLCFIVFVSSTFRITHAKTKVENTTQFSPEGNSNKTKQNSNVSIPELFDVAVLDEVPLISEVAENVELSDQSEGVKTTPIPSSTKKNVEGNIKADTSINVEDMDIIPNSFDEISNETSVTSLGNIAKSLPTSKKEDESSVEFIVTENTDLGLNSSEETRDIKTDVAVDSEKTIEHVIGNDNTNNLDFDDESPEGKERNSLEKYRDKMLEKHAEKKVKEEKKGKDKKKVKEQEGVDSYVADIPTTETSAVTAESSIHDTVDTSDEDSDTATVEVTNAVTKATDDIQKFNFASFDAGAKMLRVSDGIEASDVILKNDNDKYMMTPCASNVWWLVVQLSEDIAVTSISLSNYEHYASSVKRFQVLGSSQYPTEGWILLGQFTASKERGVQEFTMPKRVWARYLKLRILSHYGSEFYCTLTSFKAHGYTALEGFRDEMVKMSEEVADFQNLLEEDEKLPDNDVSNNDINGSDSSKIETSDSDSVKDETIGDEDDLSGVKQSGESEDNRKVVDEVVDIDDSQKQLNVDDLQTIEDNDGTIIGSEDLSKQNEDQKVDDPLEIKTRPLNGEENKTSIDELQYLPDNEKNNSQNEIQQIPDIIEDNNPSPSIDSNGNDSSSMSTNKNVNETKEDVKIDEGESSTELVPDICENCDENGTSVSSHNVDMTVNSDVTKSTTSHNDSYDDKARTAESDSVSDNNSKDINRNGKELINQVKNADEVDKTLNSASSLSNNGDKNYVTDTQVTVDSKRGNDPMKKEVVNNTVDKNTLEKNSTSAPSGTDKASNPDSTQDKSAADAIKEATAAVMDKLSSTGLIPSTVDEDKTVSQTGPVAKVKAVVLELLGHDKNPVEKVEASDNDTPTKDNEVVEENVDATGEKSTEKGFQNVPSSAETEISSTSKVDSENIPTIKEDRPKEGIPTIKEDRPKQGIPTIKEDRPKQGIDPRTLSQDLDAKSVETITNKSVKNDTISSESKPKREKNSIESTERKQIETKTKEEKRQSTQQRPKSSESMLNVFETISSQMKQIKMSQTVLEQFVNDMNTKLLSGLSTMKKSVSHVSTLTAEVAEAANGYKLAAVERKRIMEDYAAYKESILHFNKTTSKAMSELRISIAASSAAAVAGAGEAIHAVGLQSAGESMALQHQIWLQQMYMVLLGSWLLLICLRSILLTIIFACIFAVAPDEVRIPLLLICMFYYHLNSRDEVQRNSRDRKVRSWRRWCILLPYNFMCRVLRFTCCGFQLPCCRVVAWIYRCFLPREEGGVSSEVNGTMRRNMKTPSNNRSYLKWDKKHRVRRDIDRDYDSDSYSYYSDEQTPVWYSVPNRDRRMFSKYLGRDMRKKLKKRDSNVYIVKSRSSSDFGGDGDHTNQKMSSLRRRLITYSRTRSKSSVPIQNLSSAIDSPTISSPKYKVSNSLQESTEEFHSTQKENISSTNPPFVSQSSDIYNSKKKKGNQCEAD
eukprot:GSMAST32.ASY1.ANO1.2554.1 assembled CDS